MREYFKHYKFFKKALIDFFLILIFSFLLFYYTHTPKYKELLDTETFISLIYDEEVEKIENPQSVFGTAINSYLSVLENKDKIIEECETKEDSFNIALFIGKYLAFIQFVHDVEAFVYSIKICILIVIFTLNVCSFSANLVAGFLSLKDEKKYFYVI